MVPRTDSRCGSEPGRRVGVHSSMNATAAAVTVAKGKLVPDSPSLGVAAHSIQAGRPVILRNARASYRCTVAPYTPILMVDGNETRPGVRSSGQRGPHRSRWAERQAHAGRWG